MKGLTYLVSRPAALGRVVGIYMKIKNNYTTEESKKTLKDSISGMCSPFFLVRLCNHYTLFSI